MKVDVWKRYRSMILTALLVTVCGVFSVFQPLYVQRDSYLAALILNRCYDTDNYCKFCNPLLNISVGFLNDAYPNADWYTLLTRVFILIGIGCVGYYIARTAESIGEILFFYMVLFLLAVNSSLFFDYYTIWSAFFMFVGTLYLLATVKKRIRGTLTASVFLFLGIIWRMESAMLFLPFILLGLGMECIQNIKAGNGIVWGKRVFLVVLPALIVISVLVAADGAFKHSDRYAEGVRYTVAVGNAVDFPLKEYEEVAEQMEGLSRNDYRMMDIRLCADTELITVDFAETFYENAKLPLKDGNSFLESNLILLNTLMTSKKTLFNYILLIGFACLACLSRLKRYEKIELLLSLAGAYLIILYFIVIGRAPLRVINSVAYAVFAVVLAVYSSSMWRGEGALIRWGKRAIAVLVAMIVCADTFTYEFVSPQNVLQAKTEADESRWTETYGDGDIYIWELWAFNGRPMNDFMSQGKLIPEEFMEHNVVQGEWVYGQVYFNNYLERLGIPNPMRAFLERDHTYYISEDYTEVLTCLCEHYDPDVQVRKIKEIDGLPVWEFYVE